MARFKFLRQNTLICWHGIDDQEKDGFREAILIILERKDKDLLYTNGSGDRDAKIDRRDVKMIELIEFGLNLNAF